MRLGVARGGCGAVAVLLAVAACATPVSAPGAALPPLPCSGLLGVAAVFMGDSFETGLEIRGLSTTGQVSTLTEGGVSTAPVFMASGDRVLFVREVVPARPGGVAARRALWTMTPDGKDQQPLLPGNPDGWKSVTEAAESPDGSWIAFTGITEESQERDRLHVVRPDGTDLRQLTDGSSEEIFFDFELAWSPGGDRLAFVRQSPDGDRYGFQLWTINTDGGSARMVYEAPDSLDSLSWAADDSLVVNWSRGGQTTVLRVVIDSGEASEVATGSWSPALSEAGTEVTYWDLDSLDAGDGLNLITTRLADGARGVLPTASPFNPFVGMSLAPCG